VHSSRKVARQERADAETGVVGAQPFAFVDKSTPRHLMAKNQDHRHAGTAKRREETMSVASSAGVDAPVLHNEFRVGRLLDA
jgi:hypothetical protein